MFHDPIGRRLRGRRWASERWLCCSLAFSGRHRHPVWSRGYTQLFFLDEVTALAAGHRPCFECRRPDARRFCQAIGRAEGTAPPALAAVDRRLHRERLDGRGKRVHFADLSDLPDGAAIARGQDALALRSGRLLRWTHCGYADAGLRPDGTGALLTPPTIVAALRAGYRPLWHPSAQFAAPEGLASAAEMS